MSEKSKAIKKLEKAIIKADVRGEKEKRDTLLEEFVQRHEANLREEIRYRFKLNDDDSIPFYAWYGQQTDITTGERLILSIVATAIIRSDDGYFQETAIFISKYTGIAESSVKRGLTKLVEAGYLDRHEARFAGEGTRYIYKAGEKLKQFTDTKREQRQKQKERIIQAKKKQKTDTE